MSAASGGAKCDTDYAFVRPLYIVTPEHCIDTRAVTPGRGAGSRVSRHAFFTFSFYRTVYTDEILHTVYTPAVISV